MSNLGMMKVPSEGQKTFGVKSVAAETWYNCCRILMIIVGADGIISEEEMSVIREFSRMVGGNDIMIQDLMEFDFTNSRLEDYQVNELDMSWRHKILYTAIKASSKDGYAPQESLKVKQAAEIMGIAEWIATAMETLVRMEADIQTLRLALMISEY